MRTSYLKAGFFALAMGAVVLHPVSAAWAEAAQPLPAPSRVISAHAFSVAVLTS